MWKSKDLPFIKWRIFINFVSAKNSVEFLQKFLCCIAEFFISKKNWLCCLNTTTCKERMKKKEKRKKERKKKEKKENEKFYIKLYFMIHSVCV